ncbi:MAG: flippase-like domain-containing protein [Chromatiales bacterium]|nr:flippase-like domain-containing protein [Chromatiales bacterium]
MTSGRLWLLLAWAAGALLLAWLLLIQDWNQLGPLLAGVGAGMLLICAWHLLPLLADTMAWRCLLPAGSRPGLARLALMRWQGESVNAILPVAQVGGDLLRARLVQVAGVPGAQSAAAIVVDLTLSVATLALFILAGVLAATLVHGAGPLATPAVAAGTLALGALSGFFLLQRSGMLARGLRQLAAMMSGPFWAGVADAADAFDAALARLWAQQLALLRSAGWALLGWLLGAGEIWLALHFLGYQPTLLDALLIECLVQAVRNAAFMVPGALGVQEAALMLAGPWLGLPAEAGLALALLRRLRELLLGLPGLAWIWLRPSDLAGPGRV